MGLFGNKKQDDTLGSIWAVEPELVNFESVVEWLTGLSAEDYAKTCKVAEIKRSAEAQAAGVLGRPNEPRTKIDDPRDSLQTLPDPLIEDEPEFLMDDHDSTASKKQKDTAKKATKIKVNQ